jgi:hypothetical protein
MKNISLIIFVLFNYFIIQNYFSNKIINIKNEPVYQKMFYELEKENQAPIFKNNIMEDKKEVIYLY